MATLAVTRRVELSDAQWQWAATMTGLQADADAAGLITWEVSVDSTIARVHQHAAGARTRPQDLKELPGGVVNEPEDHALGIELTVHANEDLGRRQLLAIAEGLRQPP